MSVERIDPATGEVATLTEAEARRLTERIRVALDRVAHSWADLAERITEAYQRRADLALGYDSWAEYAAAELRPSEGLAADVRRQLVGMLTNHGMSTRAIAPVVGVQHSAVAKDIRRAGVSDGHTSPAAEHVDTVTGEIVTEHTAAAQWAERMRTYVETPKVTGLDGKTYTRPEPRTPARRPLVDSADDAGWELRRATEKLVRIVKDDRYQKNSDEVATRLRGHLINAIEVCQDLINQLPNPTTKENCHE